MLTLSNENIEIESMNQNIVIIERKYIVPLKKENIVLNFHYNGINQLYSILSMHDCVFRLSVFIVLVELIPANILVLRKCKIYCFSKSFVSFAIGKNMKLSSSNVSH